jgi:Uma2 family endonuclease
MSLQEFLAWEERQELRYEFDGFQPIAMTGGTIGHGAIARNVVSILTVALNGKPCQPFGSNVKTEVAGGIRYPDAFVVCTPVDMEATVVKEPVIIFEVLSKSTMQTDLTVKSAEYGATPSVRRYIVLAQDRIAATCFSWDSGVWESREIKPGGKLPLPEIALENALADVYVNIKVPLESDNNG